MSSWHRPFFFCSRSFVHPSVLVARAVRREGKGVATAHTPSLSPPALPTSPGVTARGAQKQKSPKKRHLGVATGDATGDVAGDGTAGEGAGAGVGAGVGQRPKRHHGHTTGMGGDAVASPAVGDVVVGAAEGDAVAGAATGDPGADGEVVGDATGGGVGSMGTCRQKKINVHTVRVGTAGGTGVAGATVAGTAVTAVVGTAASGNSWLNRASRGLSSNVTLLMGASG